MPLHEKHLQMAVLNELLKGCHVDQNLLPNLCWQRQAEVSTAQILWSCWFASTAGNTCSFTMLMTISRYCISYIGSTSDFSQSMSPQLLTELQKQLAVLNELMEGTADNLPILQVPQWPDPSGRHIWHRNICYDRYSKNDKNPNLLSNFF